LTEWHDASIVGLLSVGNGPKFLSFSPDKKRLYVTSSLEYNGYQGLVADRQLESNPSSYASTHREFLYPSFDLLTAIDYTSLKALGQVHLDGAVSKVVFTPDGTHGFTLNPKSNRLQALDLEALKPGAAISTGRNGVKTERFVMGSVEASASMFFPLAGIAFSAANSFIFSPANTLMSVRPDGAFVYVLNHGTNDVTVVNTKDSSVVNKIAGGGRRLQPLEGGGVLAVVAHDSIHRIDTSTQKALPEIQFNSKLIDFSLSPDGQTAVVLVEGSVLLLDGSTGEIRKRIDGFKRPQKVVFAQSQHSTEASN